MYTSALLLLPATNAQHIQLHRRMSCIASSAQHHSKHNQRRFGPSTTDWPSQQEAEAPQIDLSTTDQTSQQEAGAPQIGHSTTDCPCQQKTEAPQIDLSTTDQPSQQGAGAL